MRKTLLTNVSVIALSLGSAAFADDATQTDTDLQTQTDTDLNADTGTDLNADTGLDTESDLNADTGLDTESDLNADTGTDMNADTELGADVDTGIDSNAASGMAASDYTADELIDGTVMGADGEEIAEVDDLVIGNDNEVVEVLVNVGGFLGMGEKVVALNVEELSITHDADGDAQIVTNMTREELEGMGEYEPREGYRLQSELGTDVN